MNVLKRALKAVPLGIVGFFIISLAGSVLLKFTPMPESWGFGYIIFTFTIVCFVTAFYMGTGGEKGGLAIGLCTSLVMILIIFSIVSIVSGTGFEIKSVMKIWYIIPVVLGTVGGIIGVNIKK